MTRFTKGDDGKYNIKGQKFDMITGTRAQIWHGTAYETTGGLTKKDLMMNKHGRIVSKDKHITAKKEKRLVKAGYLTKKGKFGFIKVGKSEKSRKTRGGTFLTPLSAGDYPNSVGMVSSTDPGAVFPTTLGGKRRRRGGASLNPSNYPFGSSDDPKGLGMSQQDFLVAPNNSVLDLALTKGGTISRHYQLSPPLGRALTAGGKSRRRRRR